VAALQRCEFHRRVLTPDFIAEHMFFGYEWNDDIEAYTIATRDFKKIKEKLLFGLTNHGRPFIYVVDGNYENGASCICSIATKAWT
jgi:spore cortex formation protein SpoVR/YcgB (stage V sporulation)